ncbi:hypothetical protein EJB05_00208 [Eragrostis curvula]|uniref:Mur ligase central domain-containing protein n=1 Tax=Eragrostis curvula TaxID=38414 RepID=A0A5J9WLF9_9POAL|nr:hypothetical protein EJB05_00208 [Eragrostis curvula]
MLGRFPFALRRSCGLLRVSSRSSSRRGLSAMTGVGGGDEAQLRDFFEYMERLKNYERSGVPRGAGTDSDDGFDLGRMRRLLRRLGDPHTHFPAVHIAGTKGKGSTAAFLSSIMRNQGYNVGCYSSPHLLTIRERISVGNGGPVPVGLLRDLFDEAKDTIDESIVSENGTLTHFEVFTALSFLLFSRENVDIAIIEAGLGGARDATNVIQSTELAASVITTVGREHLAALGGSLQSIAVAKSGIIKQGRPVVIGGPFPADIEQIIRDRAFLTRSPVISAYDPGVKSITKCIDWDNGKPYQICDIGINISNGMPLSIELKDIKLQLLGDHQRQNAVTASCTALCLRNLAHTEASAKALSGVIEAVKPEGPLALVVGMASDKEHLAFAEQLLSGPLPDIVLLTEASIAGGNSRAMPASSLKELWIAAAQDQGINHMDIGTVSGKETPECIRNLAVSSSSSGKCMLIGCQDTPFWCGLIKVASQLLESRGADSAAPGLICVTGSLHLVASVLKQLEQQ